MASEFELLPAIDLIAGRVVRLEQGDFDRETSFSADPLAVATTFASGGATWLHIVDLDGARSGRPQHGVTVRAIVAALGTSVRIDLAGGLRTLEAIEEAVAAGATRVVIGTAALREPPFVAFAVAALGAGRVAVALDVRGGLAIGEGWRNGAPGVPPGDAIRRLADVGVETFEVTSIDRDGLLGGPDLGMLGELVAVGRGRIIASGGVARVEDIAAVRRLGCAGVIVGRSLYDGSLDLSDALFAASTPIA
ncbi:MAG TPA: 1-(5-phosphoribosyl)-5-[(5-phosphoribosylamino)methylideneamino] imidazole-4-carboxamide isomerase [Candidatus Dormibacteraeota bacterium]|nr:1-(5-phosphoribosyl)-5-[(5-phosphoribosylamino)methylideneamino] imidazole-4-carboxamide isomerase [Candidatus Dormibacteraeota bacterium]